MRPDDGNLVGLSKDRLVIEKYLDNTPSMIILRLVIK
jgi:hypothetical protein